VPRSGRMPLGNISSTIVSIWKLAVPYFRSEDRRAGGLLLGAVIGLELAAVGVMVLINQWNARFYNALQDRAWNNFVHELLLFGGLAAVFICVRVYQNYLTQWLQIRWRRWLTSRYLGHWLDGANHYRMQVLGDGADNPDQRIAEDTRMFVELTLGLGIGLLGSIVTLLSFVTILWGLSAQAPLRLLSLNWSIPGYLVWAALAYSFVGTAVTHLIGRSLIRLNFNQQRYEADFRFSLVRVRENAEQIALLKGERAERVGLMERFAKVANNWLAIMSRQKKLTFFTTSFQQVAIVFPYVVASPAYFSGLFQLGGLMQTASAFSSVQSALSFFANSNTYREFAEWRAVIARLKGFDESIAVGRAACANVPVTSTAQDMQINALEVWLPKGESTVAADSIVFAPGDRVLVAGPSGSGKSTLFRAIAGIWPLAVGNVTVPVNAKVMMLPQRPYLPIGSLESAIIYPADLGEFTRARIVAVLHDVGLSNYVERLDETGHWSQQLSLGEQQRLGLARAILHKPDFLFLDEATASLDEAAEAALYRLIEKQLPCTTIISIGHRSTLKIFHKRTLKLLPEGDWYRLYETVSRPAFASLAQASLVPSLSGSRPPNRHYQMEDSNIVILSTMDRRVD